MEGKKSTLVMLVAILVVAGLVAGYAFMKNNREVSLGSLSLGGREKVDILNKISSSVDHSTFASTVQTAGLGELMSGTGPFTVFAPNNEAFNKMSQKTLMTWMEPDNKNLLVDTLTYHVVPGKYTSSDLQDGMSLTTVYGQLLKVSFKDGSWWVNDSAMITKADMGVSNGVVHVVDGVLTTN